MKREYKIKDIAEFIQEYYGYDWRGFRVLNEPNYRERTPRASDFKNDYFSAIMILYKNNKRVIRYVECSNVIFNIHGENNVFAHERWQGFLAHKANIEETI